MKIIYSALVLLLVGCNDKDMVESSDRGKYYTVCVEGHTYYEKRLPLSNTVGVAIKLDDNGKPIPCTVETE